MKKQLLLTVENLRVQYRRKKLLNGVNLKVYKDSILCITGKNGSGKSTLLKAIMGKLPHAKGKIKLSGKDTSGLPVREMVQNGVGYLMQKSTVFPSLSVFEHIHLANQKNQNDSINQVLKKIKSIFPHLLEMKDVKAAQLSGGERRLLGFAMLIAQGSETLWVLDEPSAGVAPNMVDRMMAFVQNSCGELTHGVLLVEQNLEAGLSIADSVIVLQNGKTELLDNSNVNRWQVRENISKLLFS